MAIGGPPRASCDIRNRDKCWPAWEKYSKQYGTKLPTHSSETIARVLQGVNRAFVHQFHYGALWLEYLAMEFQRHGPPEAIPDSFMDDTSFAAKGWAVGSGGQVINSIACDVCDVKNFRPHFTLCPQDFFSLLTLLFAHPWLEYLAMEFQRNGPPEAIPDSFMDDTSFAAKGWAVGSGRQVINIYIYIIYIYIIYNMVFLYSIYISLNQKG